MNVPQGQDGMVLGVQICQSARMEKNGMSSVLNVSVHTKLSGMEIIVKRK